MQSASAVPMPAARADTRPWVTWVVCLLPLLTYLLPQAFLPLTGDEGIYSVIALKVLDGGVPYRDALDLKPPLVYGWYALGFTLFGTNDLALRLIATPFACGTVYFILRLARELLPAGRAPWVAAASAIALGAPLLEIGANTEVFALLPATAAAWLLIHAEGRPSARTAALAGLLSGIAVWTRPSFAFGVAGLGLWLLVHAMRDRRLWPLAAFVLAGLATIPAVLAPFWLAGARDDLRYALIELPRLYFRAAVRTPGYAWYWQVLVLAWYWRELAHALAAVAPLAVAAYFSIRGRARQLVGEARWKGLLAWQLGVLIGVLANGRFASHHLLQLLPLLVLLAGGLWESTAWRPERRSRTAGVLVVALAAAVLVNGAHYLERLSPRDRYQQAAELGPRIASMTCPGDLVWESGRTSTPYFYANRASPTRFFWEHAFFIDERTLPLAVRDLHARPPALIFDTSLHREQLHAVLVSPVGDLYYPRGIGEFIEANYTLFERTEFAAIYLRDGNVRDCA